MEWSVYNFEGRVRHRVGQGRAGKGREGKGREINKLEP